MTDTRRYAQRALALLPLLLTCSLAAAEGVGECPDCAPAPVECTVRSAPGATHLRLEITAAAGWPYGPIEWAQLEIRVSDDASTFALPDLTLEPQKGEAVVEVAASAGALDSARVEILTATTYTSIDCTIEIE